MIWNKNRETQNKLQNETFQKYKKQIKTIDTQQQVTLRDENKPSDRQRETKKNEMN